MRNYWSQNKITAATTRRTKPPKPAVSQFRTILDVLQGHFLAALENCQVGTSSTTTTGKAGGGQSDSTFTFSLFRSIDTVSRKLQAWCWVWSLDSREAQLLTLLWDLEPLRPLRSHHGSRELCRRGSVCPCDFLLGRKLGKEWKSERSFLQERTQVCTQP